MGIKEGGREEERERREGREREREMKREVKEKESSEGLTLSCIIRTWLITCIHAWSYQYSQLVPSS